MDDLVVHFALVLRFLYLYSTSQQVWSERNFWVALPPCESCATRRNSTNLY